MDTCHAVGPDPKSGRLGPDLSLELGARPAFGLPCGRAFNRLGCGSCTRPDFPPWADQDIAS
jgi:hypothetical protein